MAGFLPADSKAYLLGQLATQALYLGLATDIPSGNDVTLANITEVSKTLYPAYARVGITYSAPGATDWNVDPIQMANSADILFAALASDISGVDYAFVTDQATASALAAPASLAAGTATSGGTFAAGTYYWVVTAKNAKGETIASNEVNKTVTANQEVPLTWSAVSGATSYNVYRGTVAGAESVLVVNQAGTSYTDTGAAGTSATPPSSNTAAVGRIYWVWTLPEAASALAGKPFKAPAGGLIIE